MSRVAAIVESEYDDFKDEVLRTVSAKLAGAGVQVTGLDLEAFYNAAWQSLYLKLRSGEEVTNRKGFLVTVTYREALSEHRAGIRQQLTDGQSIDSIAEDVDLDADLDSRRQLRELREGLKMRLSERELQAATLCYLHGYSRRQAASALGVSRRRMEKIMDRVSLTVGSLAGPIRAGRWCDEVDSLIRAYAAGILSSDGERYRLAREHLDDCPACRRKVLLLRGLIAVSPPLPLAGLLAAGLTGEVGAGGAASAGEPGSASSAGAGGSGSSVGTGTIAVGAVAVAACVAVGVGVIASGTPSDPEPVRGEAPSATQVRAKSDGATQAEPTPKAESAPSSTPDRSRRPSRAAQEPGPDQPPAPAVSEPIEPPPAPLPEPAAPVTQPEPAPTEPAEPQRKEPPLRDAAIEFELH